MPWFDFQVTVVTVPADRGVNCHHSRQRGLSPAVGAHDGCAGHCALQVHISLAATEHPTSRLRVEISGVRLTVAV